MQPSVAAARIATRVAAAVLRRRKADLRRGACRYAGRRAATRSAGRRAVEKDPCESGGDSSIGAGAREV
ncbi:MAG: hypothetical protein OXG81_05540 [Acidobacteria bacterium]|nr:hypothetical protein [Acidobacteriota bacterium]